MHLVAKPKENYIGSSSYCYVLDCGGLIQESDHLVWLQTLFIIQMMLEEANWETARKKAERLAIRMNQLQSIEDACFLANWTLRALEEGAEKQ